MMLFTGRKRKDVEASIDDLEHDMKRAKLQETNYSEYTPVCKSIQIPKALLLDVVRKDYADSLLARAIHLADEEHSGQMRRGGSEGKELVIYEPDKQIQNKYYQLLENEKQHQMDID